jgi:Rod binding domain-containing protein
MQPLQVVPSSPTPGATHSPRARSQRSFLAVLGRAQDDSNAPPEARARDAAEQWVAATLVQPLLKQLRDMNTAAPPFGPGPGEKQFRALMDAETAQRITSATHFPLVDRVARQLLKKHGGAGALPPMALQPPDPALVNPSLGFNPSASR